MCCTPAAKDDGTSVCSVSETRSARKQIDKTQRIQLYSNRSGRAWAQARTAATHLLQSSPQGAQLLLSGRPLVCFSAHVS